MNDSGQPVPALEFQPAAVAAQAAQLSGYPPSPPPYPFPLTFSQILDRVFFLLRAHFRLLVGVAIIPFAVFFLLAAGPMGYFIYQVQHSVVPGTQPHLPWTFFLFYPVFAVLGVVVYAFYFAAGSHAALSADCGIRLTISHCFHLAWERIGRNIGLMLLMTLYAMAPLIVIMIAAILLAILAAAFHYSSPAAAYLAMPLFIVVFIGVYVWMIVLMIRLSLVFPASVAEDLSAVEAIRRSGQLTRGAKGRIFLVMLLVYAATYLVILVSVAIVSGLVAFAALAFSSLHLELAPPWSYLGFILLIPLWLAAMVLWTAVPMAAIITTLAVFYRDQRLRIEGVAPAGAR
jgi:MFS family permease